MTKALILAAGQGTRLRPLTDDRPKCLVSLLGHTLLERQINTLKTANISRIQVATGYRCEQIKALGLDTVYNPHYAATNMVESLFSARDFILQDSDDLIISYGDIVYQLDNLLALMACSDDIALMIDRQWLKLWSIRFNDPMDDAETLKINDQGYIIELGKKPSSLTDIQGQYTGLIKIRGDKLKAFDQYYQNLDRKISYDGKDFLNMYMTSFLQGLIHAGFLAKAVMVDNGWLEVDSVEDLSLYQTLHQQGELAELIQL